MWEGVMDGNPSFYKNCSKLPVERVSWNDCQDFIQKLNVLGVAPKGYRFSLPTEAQWEYEPAQCPAESGSRPFHSPNESPFFPLFEPAKIGVGNEGNDGNDFSEHSLKTDCCACRYPFGALGQWVYCHASQSFFDHFRQSKIRNPSDTSRANLR